MKKIISIMLSLVLVISTGATLSVFAFGSNTDINANAEINETVSYTDFMQKRTISEENNIVVISEDEFSAAESYIAENFEEFKALIQSGTILVVENYRNKNNNTLDNALNVPFTVDDVETDTTASIDEAELVTTAYYYSNGVFGISELFEDGVNEEDLDALINEFLSGVLSTIETTGINAVAASSADATEKVGIYQATYASPPHLNFTVTYDIYTLQNFEQSDFYTVIGTIHANPGLVMNKTNSSYEKKWLSRSLKVTYGSTSPLIRDTYGPYSSDNCTSYSWNVGASFDGKGITVDAGFSGSYTILSTDISVASTNTNTTWTLSYDSDAQKQTNSFSPAMTMKRPKATTKPSVTITTEYTVRDDTFLISIFTSDVTKSLTKTISIPSSGLTWF